MPRARIAATGAMPLASFRFDDGQCATLTPSRAMVSSSRGLEVHRMHGDEARAHDTEAAQALERAHAVLRDALLDLVQRLVHVAVDRQVELLGEHRDLLHHLVAHGVRRVGREAEGEEVLALVRVARREALLQVSPRHRGNRRWETRSRSRPSEARIPARSAARAVASGKKYMSFTQVTPPRSISAMAMRLPSCTNSSLTCFASAGQMCCCSQVISGTSSAMPRMSVIAAWQCRFTRPGISAWWSRRTTSCASYFSSAAAVGSTSTMRPSFTATA
jgi:hypothetical protein